MRYTTKRSGICSKKLSFLSKIGPASGRPFFCSSSGKHSLTFCGIAGLYPASKLAGDPGCGKPSVFSLALLCLFLRLA
jgi:hypothetical protein